MTRVELPSGLVGEIRKLRGIEIAAASEASQDSNDGDSSFAALLNGCWLETISSDPYPFVAAGDSKPAWRRMAKGDLLVALVRIRQISLPDGDNFEFDVACASQDCGKKITWTVPLSTLDIKPLPERSREAFRSGVPLKSKLGGKTISWWPARLENEGSVTTLQRQMKRRVTTLVDVIVSRIVHVDGAAVTPRLLWQWVSGIDFGELEELYREMEDADCGIESDIDIRCPACGWERDCRLPLLGRRFFLSRQRSRTVWQPESSPPSSLDTSSMTPGDGSPSGSSGSNTGALE